MTRFDRKGKESAAGAVKPMQNIMRDALRPTLLRWPPNHDTIRVLPLELTDPF